MGVVAVGVPVVAPESLILLVLHASAYKIVNGPDQTSKTGCPCCTGTNAILLPVG